MNLLTQLSDRSYTQFRTQSGKYIENVLYSFKGFAAGDGQNPHGGVILDKSGDIFGTTAFGGAGSQFCSQSGCGTVFELIPTASGYAEHILFLFPSEGFGMPYAGLVMDGSGSLYGTTVSGEVFELTPTSSGYAETTIANFAKGGAVIESAPTMDDQGRLFGTTLNLGMDDAGTVFELTPGSSGYVVDTIYQFEKPLHHHGNSPFGVIAVKGKLIGTTAFGGGNGHGTVFELAP